MSKKSKTANKLLIRNVQVPVNTTKNKSKVFKHCTIQKDVAPEGCATSSRKIPPDLSSPSEKYSKPELNSCMEIVKKMQDIKQMKLKRIETASDLTPKSKQVYRHEFTKVLNLPHDKKIYHHLIPLNVNDSILLPTEKKKEKQKRRIYIPGAVTDLEPQLEDFLTEIEPIKLTFPITDESYVITKTNTEQNFNYLQSLYNNFGPDAV